jgi:hypothetical protein
MAVKCEDCGKVIKAKELPSGWSQIGESKYGKKYDKDGLASYCPKCWK